MKFVALTFVALASADAGGDGCAPLITQRNWMDCITGPGSYILAEGEFFLDRQFQIPDGVHLGGSGLSTVIVAARAVENGCGSKAGKPGDPHTRIGFVLGNNVRVGNFTFKGRDTHRFNPGDALCGGFVFETPGCSDAYCVSPENIGDQNYGGNGISNSKIENVYITGVTFEVRAQGAVHVTQTRDLSKPSHHLWITGVRMDRSWADGINLHGSVHDVQVDHCHISNTGDDSYAVWSAGDLANAVTFKSNVAINPRMETAAQWGNCVAFYGGSALWVDGLQCQNPFAAAVKFTESYRGKFGPDTGIYLSNIATDNGSPDCWFAEGNKGWDVEGCMPPHASIQNTWSSLCLDVPNGQLYNGAVLQQWACNGHASQHWLFESGSYNIKSAIDPKFCIDRGTLAKGGRLFVWECNGKPQQRIEYDYVHTKRIFWDGVGCMDVESGSLASGASVILWDCNSHINQHWVLGAQSVGAPFENNSIESALFV